MRHFIVWVFCIFAVLFSTKISAQTVTVVNNMSFGNNLVGTGATVTITPTGTGAAVFNATGMTPGRTVTCSIPTSSVTINNGGSGAPNNITVNAFTISGCTSVVPASGAINGIGVGATATINSNDNAGTFTGSNTFRLVISTF